MPKNGRRNSGTDPAAAVHQPVPPLPQADWAALQLQAQLGEGASGVIHRATHLADGAAHDTAVKLFKGAMTSDGLPRSEMAASIAAGAHPNIVAIYDFGEDNNIRISFTDLSFLIKKGETAN